MANESLDFLCELHRELESSPRILSPKECRGIKRIAQVEGLIIQRVNGHYLVNAVSTQYGEASTYRLCAIPARSLPKYDALE